MGVASLAGLAVGLSRAGAHRVSLRLSARVNKHRIFTNTKVGFFSLIVMSWELGPCMAGIRGRVRYNALSVVISYMESG